MASPGDLRAARILLAIAVAGALVRIVDRGPGPPGGVAFDRAPGVERPGRDSVAMEARRVGQPLRRGERIDPNQASAAELMRLPRIGPALAARIVRHRDSAGAFRSLADLQRVSGIGPGLAGALAPYLTVGPETPERTGRVGPAMVVINAASADELAALPGIGPVRARAIVEERTRGGAFKNLADLTRVKGIGAATIERLRGRVRVP